MKEPVTRERFRKALPQAIVWLREKRGLTQAQLARKLDISSATMCRYEKGNYKPGVVRLAHILEVLGCDFGDLDDALKQVSSAEGEGLDPLPDLLLQDDPTEDDKLMAIYATAEARGQGDLLVERVIRQAKRLSRLRRYMKKLKERWPGQEAADGAEDPPPDEGFHALSGVGGEESLDLGDEVEPSFEPRS